MRTETEAYTDLRAAPVERPRQSETPLFGIELAELDLLARAAEARRQFNVDGRGLAVAVLDTGLRSSHVDFEGRVVAQRNFTPDNGGRFGDAGDGHGHGTNVAGIIAAGKDHIGIAPGANIVPLKVLSERDAGGFAAVGEALQWVIENQARFDISAVCMAFGDGGNYSAEAGFEGDAVRSRIRELHGRRVAVCAAAGNHYFRHGSRQGMGYPAILRETVSVGAVYDGKAGRIAYACGAVAHSTAPDRLTPFSQRLHESLAHEARTDIFAPGAPVTSSGIAGDRGESTQRGTSQATPLVTGVVLLMQAYYRRVTGELPPVEDLVAWMRASGTVIHDREGGYDNVAHTNLDFRRVDAPAALHAVYRHLQMRMLAAA